MLVWILARWMWIAPICVAALIALWGVNAHNNYLKTMIIPPALSEQQIQNFILTDPGLENLDLIILVFPVLILVFELLIYLGACLGA